jgi:hypothetical protein
MPQKLLAGSCSNGLDVIHLHLSSSIPLAE